MPVQSPCDTRLKGSSHSASNVSSLAELAYRYGVEQLRADCERHLRYCPDILFAMRLQLAHRFHLDAAKEQLCEEAPRDALEAFIRSI